MKENLLSFKIVSAVVLAGVVVALTTSAAAAANFPRSLALLAPSARTPSAESVLSGTLVGPDGLTAISSIDLKWDAPTGFGELNEASVTAAGQVSSRDANLERQPDGTLIARGTMTDFDGHSVNYTETLRRIPGGYVARGTTAGLPGETSTYETTVVLVGRSELRRTTVTTHADGATSTRVEKLMARESEIAR